MELQNAFDKFILSRELASLSKKTIDAYNTFCMPFIRVAPEKGIEMITQDDIDSYIIELLKRPISKSTKATYVRHLKIFLKWCEGEYPVQYTAKKIRVPKDTKREVLLYTPAQLETIFSSVSADEDWIVYRNKCIIALMYDSGLRQSETCTLLRSKVVMPENRLTVHGKGEKERTVPLGELTRLYMLKYLELCPYEAKHLFVNRRGEPLTCNSVKLFVTKLARKVPFELSSHKLRHNFATNYCIDQYDTYGQVDIYKLMYLMGHEEIETTQRYLHFAMEIIASRSCISHLDKVLEKVV